MEVKAVEKYIRISPKKARPVADVIRGQKAEDALTVLRFMPKKGAGIIAKALKSAVANAEHNFNADKESLYIKKITVDSGPSLKRYKHRSRGMVSHILKRTSHVTVIVTDEAPVTPVKNQVKKAKEVKPEAKKTAAEKTTAKKETK